MKITLQIEINDPSSAQRIINLAQGLDYPAPDGYNFVFNEFMPSITEALWKLNLYLTSISPDEMEVCRGLSASQVQALVAEIARVTNRLTAPAQ